MRHFILLVGTLLVSSFCFAQVSIPQSSNPTQKALGSAWKSYRSIQPGSEKHDIMMGYAGQDLSNRPTLDSHMATA